VGGPVRVGVPEIVLDYYRLKGPIHREGLVYLPVKPGLWFDARPEVFVLPEWLEIAIRRDLPGTPMARDLARLDAGTAGYREAARWRSWYLQRDLYTRLDPAFAGDLWQGEMGFTVYLRE
jgi:hypothetical protein